MFKWMFLWIFGRLGEMAEAERCRKARLRLALLDCFDLRGLLNLMERDQYMKRMLRTVMNEMGERERAECKRTLQEAILNLVQSSPRLQEMMACIKGKCCDLWVYERIWQELVAEANKDDGMELFHTTDSPEEPEIFEEIVPCGAFEESVAWWRQDGLQAVWPLDVPRAKPCKSNSHVVTNEHFPCTTPCRSDGVTDSEEERQVHRVTDWGDETLEMRRKRYRRMKARKEGINVPSKEQDVDMVWY